MVSLTKRCNKCRLEKPLGEFYGRGPQSTGGRSYVNSLAGYSSACKECTKARQTEYRTANPEKVRESWRRTTYRKNFGITLERYNEMYEEQAGACAICHTHQSDLKMALAVDHNHATGAVRGLLCAGCNSAIGHVYENVEVLESAINYLIRFEPDAGNKTLGNTVTYGQ